MHVLSEDDSPARVGIVEYRTVPLSPVLITEALQFARGQQLEEDYLNPMLREYEYVRVDLDAIDERELSMPYLSGALNPALRTSGARELSKRLQFSGLDTARNSLARNFLKDHMVRGKKLINYPPPRYCTNKTRAKIVFGRRKGRGGINDAFYDQVRRYERYGDPNEITFCCPICLEAHTTSLHIYTCNYCGYLHTGHPDINRMIQICISGQLGAHDTNIKLLSLR